MLAGPAGAVEDADEDSFGARRIEPGIAIDEESLDTQRPAIERRAGFEAPADDAAQGTHASRREPTLGRRDETEASGRPEAAAGVRVEPTLTSRPEPAQGVRVEAGERRPEPESARRASPAIAVPDAPKPAADAASAKVRRIPQKIFAVRVGAVGASKFAGERVLEALQAENLRFGRYDIFHCLHEDGRPVFSVASLRDPGTFDLAEMVHTEFPGILVFTVLPGPVDAGDAFDEMLFTARALATHLEGALADDKGVPLTAQRASRMREEALEFERSLHAA